jgi:hypothetical protein
VDTLIDEQVDIPNSPPAFSLRPLLHAGILGGCVVRPESEADACRKDHELYGFHMSFPHCSARPIRRVRSLLFDLGGAKSITE